MALNVILYPEGDAWIAQAIEADIVASAATLEKLPDALERAVEAILEANARLGRYGFDGIPPAPPEFREMFDLSDIVLYQPRADFGRAIEEHFNIRLLAA